MPNHQDRGDDQEWLIIGRAGKPHGIHGDILVEIITDFPERLQEKVTFGLGDETSPAEFFEVHRVRYHKGRWLLSVSGLRDRNSIEGWRGRYLYLPQLALDELPEGFYYEHHLMGLECRAPDGLVLGKVVALDRGDAQSRLLIRRGDREYLVPYVPEIVLEVDIEAGSVLIDAPPGLLDDPSITP